MEGGLREQSQVILDSCCTHPFPGRRGARWRCWPCGRWDRINSPLLESSGSDPLAQVLRLVRGGNGGGAHCVPQGGIGERKLPPMSVLLVWDHYDDPQQDHFVLTPPVIPVFFPKSK